MSRRPVICPHCEKPMNHHADKLREPESDDDRPDVGFDGVVWEVHACVTCNATTSARARDLHV